MPLTDFLLLRVRQVANLIGSRRYRCVNGKLTPRKMIYSFVHCFPTVGALTLLPIRFALPMVVASKFFLYLLWYHHSESRGRHCYQEVLVNPIRQYPKPLRNILLAPTLQPMTSGMVLPHQLGYATPVHEMSHTQNRFSLCTQLLHTLAQIID